MKMGGIGTKDLKKITGDEHDKVFVLKDARHSHDLCVCGLCGGAACIV